MLPHTGKNSEGLGCRGTQRDSASSRGASSVHSKALSLNQELLLTQREGNVVLKATNNPSQPFSRCFPAPARPIGSLKLRYREKGRKQATTAPFSSVSQRQGVCRMHTYREVKQKQLSSLCGVFLPLCVVFLFC